MNNLFAVEIFESFGDLAKYNTCFSFVKVSTFVLDIRKQVASGDQLLKDVTWFSVSLHMIVILGPWDLLTKYHRFERLSRDVLHLAVHVSAFDGNTNMVNLHDSNPSLY